MTLIRPATLLVALVLILAAIYLPQYAKPQTATITTYGNSAAVTAASPKLTQSGTGAGFFNGGANSFSFGFAGTAAGCFFHITVDERSEHQHQFKVPCADLDIDDVLKAFPHLPEPLKDALRIVLEIVLRVRG